MKWIFFLLMVCLILPGLHFTGFITLFQDSSSKLNAHHLPEKEKWSAIPTPQWQAQDWNENIFSLKQLKGQIIILNFWASWCLPCHKEFPELIAATEWAKGNISLVAISVDDSKEDIKNFLNQHRKHLANLPNQLLSKKKQYVHIVRDPNFKIAHQFNVVKLPETFILNRDLKIVKKYTGEFSLEKAKDFLKSIVTKTKPGKN